MDKFIYAIIANHNNTNTMPGIMAEINGITGADLFAISFGKISAIASNLNRTDFTINQAVAVAYAGVIDELGKHFTLLPMQLGSFMKSTDDITKLLRENQQEFYQNLLKVENKHEFGLKIFGDFRKIKENLEEAQAPEPQNNQPADDKKSMFKAYVNKKLKEHRLEEKLMAYADTIIAKLSESLDSLEAITKLKKMTSESIIVDAVFLLDKENKEPLIAAVSNLQNQNPDLKIVLTGPWPPYNFVDVKIK